MRILSLLSSATEIVAALGLEDELVGISHECDHPPHVLDRPRVSRSRFDPAGLTGAEIDEQVRRHMREHGSVYEVDRELLGNLEPGLVLTQGVCEVCAVPVGDAVAAVRTLDPAPEVLSLDAHRIDDILQSVRQVANAAGEPARGDELAGSLRARLDAVAERVAGRARPRVLMLEWLEPPFVPGHWVPEMITRAGGEPLLAEPVQPSREVEWSSLEGLHPDVLCIEPCGYDLERAGVDAGRSRDRLLRIAPHAIQQGRSWLLHSSYFSRSGPRVVEGVEALAAVLHPEAFPESARAGVARRWIPPSP